jgi:hypothetical protein
VSFHFVRTRVEFSPARLAWPEADALVLPTNDYLWMATGPALEIKKLAGEEVEFSAVRLGPIPLGDVVVGPAGNLPLSGIIHAAVMGQDLQLDTEKAALAIERALQLGVTRKWPRLLLHSLLATGRGTKPEAIRAPLSRLVEFLLEGTSLRSITILLANEGEGPIFHEAMLRIVQGHR